MPIRKGILLEAPKIIFLCDLKNFKTEQTVAVKRRLSKMASPSGGGGGREGSAKLSVADQISQSVQSTSNILHLMLQTSPAHVSLSLSLYVSIYLELLFRMGLNYSSCLSSSVNYWLNELHNYCNDWFFPAYLFAMHDLNTEVVYELVILLE